MNHKVDNKLFYQLLVGQRDELNKIEQISSDSAKPVELDQTCVGRLSRMDAMQSQAISIQTEQRRKSQLQRIGAAIERINNDEFGYCLKCDEPIPNQRLQIDPCSTLCVSCASKLEAK